MGLAIIVPDVNFADANLGQVTLTDDVPIQAISINAPSTFVGIEIEPTIVYTPLNTTQRGVTWSIVNGSAYATIDSSTGKITILSGTNNNNITVKAASTVDTDIEATKIINVTYASSGNSIRQWILSNTETYYRINSTTGDRQHDPAASGECASTVLSDIDSATKVTFKWNESPVTGDIGFAVYCYNEGGTYLGFKYMMFNESVSTQDLYEGTTQICFGAWGGANLNYLSGKDWDIILS